MTEKIYALDLNSEEWVTWLTEELKQPKFRADQICQWIWEKKIFDTDEMTNLSLPLRELLNSRADFSAPMLISEQRSSIDGTRKYLWQLRDGHSVESVLLRQNDRLTACISTQVGCPLQCTFCATGLSGYIRNLSAGEIAGQFLAMEKTLDHEINNVVYMGMGEPFLNTDAVLKSVRMLNSPKQRNLGIRHITISTSGIIPGINQLAQSGLGLRLAISLHAADDELRSMLMPVNQTYPLSELRKAMQEYQSATGDRITIEYALFGGVNDSIEHARLLVRFLKGIHVFINLIPFNAVDGRYEKPKPEDILRFRTILTTAGFEAEIRSEQGADIDAACGQLRRKTMNGAPCALEPKPHTVTTADMTRREEPKARPEQNVRKREPRTGDYSRSASNAERGEVTKRPSGGFVEERYVKRRKFDKPEQERYRSGKMKEARPSYRGQGESEAQPQDGSTQRNDKPKYGDKPSYGNRQNSPRGDWSQRDKPRYGDKAQNPRSAESGDRPKYGEKPQGTRGEWAKREKPSYGDRQNSPRGDWSQRDKPRYGDKAQNPRSAESGDRPKYGEKPQGTRGEWAKREKPSYGDRQNSPRGDWSQRDKPRYGDKAQNPRSAESGDRPKYSEKPQGMRGEWAKREKPSYGDRQNATRGDWSQRDKPRYGDKAQNPRSAESGDRPKYGEKPQGTRPAKPSKKNKRY